MSREQTEGDMILNFSEITGASVENSKFFLESANWNLEYALAGYYDTFGGPQDLAARFPDEFGAQGDHSPANNHPLPNQPALNPNLPQLPLHSGDGDFNMDEQNQQINAEGVIDVEESEDIRDIGSPEVEPVPPLVSTTSGSTRPRFATISSIRSQDSNSDDEAQTYYAGGSEHSGQQVVGPSRSTNELISEMFRSVRDQGGVEASSEFNNMVYFSGRGYRLGQTPDEVPVVATPTNTGSSNNSATTQTREIILRLWRDGFSLDNGSLRSYNDQANVDFLTRVRQGNIPPELIPELNDLAINLSMEDRRNEYYVPSVTGVVPFAGSGHVLGSGTTSTVDETEENNGAAAAIPTPQVPAVDVNRNEPIANIQVRLPDGNRIRVTLNHTHTIGDLRNVIIQERPEYGNGQFTLMIGFPSRELVENEQSVKEADICKTCILLLKK